MEVYYKLGNGFLEKVYENALMYELELMGIYSENQKEIKVEYKERLVGNYIEDIVVDKKIIVELKAIRNVDENSEAQLLNYLKATGFKVGYIINFGHPKKLQFKRMVL